MSNLYEALLQAQNDKLNPVPDLAEEDYQQPSSAAESRSGKGGLTLETEVCNLYESVEALWSDDLPKSLQFIGPRGGEGVSTVVREYARVAASLYKRRVLVLDAAHHNPSQHHLFDHQAGYGWLDACSNKEPLLKACYQSGNSTLFHSPISSQTSLSPWIKDRASATNLFKELKEVFELILIDSSPAATSPDSISLSRFSDGVIMVLEAERTGWRVAEDLKNRLVKNGANVLGAVFNKRRYYIPPQVYKLF